MTRASEDFLGSIHALVGEEIRDMLQDVDPRQRREGVQLALKFLKDNNITAQIEASEPLANIASSLPSAAELEKLMTMTPE
tara:strand:- start:251 stop:493 length:243 start_codon:yes stop_codon:yes gene_type:complete